MLLGVGIGGFFDGIVFHQILQWHHVVSTPLPPDSLGRLEVNTFWDGLFHAVTWVVTVVAVLVLLSGRAMGWMADARRRSVGGLLIGWGAFNLVEGVIDHHILGIHHVRPGPDELLYDVAFLAWGMGMLVLGAVLVRRRNAGVTTLPDRRSTAVGRVMRGG